MVKTVFLTLFQESIGSVLYYPIWWYTHGAVYAFMQYRKRVIFLSSFLAIQVWVQNWFKPMYGQYDIGGRIISFFIRTIQIIVRTCVFVIGVLFLTLWLTVWFLILPILILLIVYYALLI